MKEPQSQLQPENLTRCETPDPRQRPSAVLHKHVPVTHTSPTSIEESAVAKVFRLTELLEAILSNLPVRELLLSQRTSQSFRDVVQSSTKLKRLLFLQPEATLSSAIPAANPFVGGSINFKPPCWKDRKNRAIHLRTRSNTTTVFRHDGRLYIVTPLRGSMSYAGIKPLLHELYIWELRSEHSDDLPLRIHDIRDTSLWKMSILQPPGKVLVKFHQTHANARVRNNIACRACYYSPCGMKIDSNRATYFEVEEATIATIFGKVGEWSTSAERTRDEWNRSRSLLYLWRPCAAMEMIKQRADQERDRLRHSGSGLD